MTPNTRPSPPSFPGPYRAYGHWLKERHGGRVHRLSIDGGFTCPNRDGRRGRGGCTYCNVDSFVPSAVRRLPSISEQVARGLSHLRRRHGDGVKVILYFQANTNTDAPVAQLKALYDEALAAAPPDLTVGLVVGTRPDCLDESKMALLASYTDRVEVCVELGLESVSDATLERVNRGHTHREFLQAQDFFKDSPVQLGLHLILGFPWEGPEAPLDSARVVNESPAQFLKLHHLHVVRGSAMGVEWVRKPFPLPSLEGWAKTLEDMIPRLRPDLVVQRLCASTLPVHLLAPEWTARPSEARAFLEAHLDRAGVKQGSGWPDRAIPPKI